MAPDNEPTTLGQRLSQAIVELREDAVGELVQEALAVQMPRQDLLASIGSALEEVGNRYASGEYFLPELVMCGSMTKEAMAALQPLLETGGADRQRGRVVIGTVAGDLHDLGKNLVISMLTGAGFEVHDLGINVPSERFVTAIREYHPDVLGLSALLLTTREEMRRVIQALDTAGLRTQVRVIIGGCVVTEQFARDIGADGFGKDAVAAVRLVRRFVGASCSENKA